MASVLENSFLLWRNECAVFGNLNPVEVKLNSPFIPHCANAANGDIMLGMCVICIYCTVAKLKPLAMRLPSFILDYLNAGHQLIRI